jgi:hypothetical protein
MKNVLRFLTLSILFIFWAITVKAQDVTLNGPTACNGAAIVGTWTVPCGVTSITVDIYGGGGGAGGGGGGSNGGLFGTRGGGGGGGGGHASITISVTPGSTFNYSIGGGGCGGSNGGDGSSGGNGTAGGNTTFNGPNANLVANGGARGTGGSGSNGSPGSGGAGGTASGGTTNLSGTAGNNGSGGTGGSGGAGAGPDGGAGGANTNNPGTALGGGGAGGGDSQGGRGAAGGIRITYGSAVVLPDTPLISSVPPTCLNPGTSAISNYDANATYVFTPTGPTVTANGSISSMVIGTNYTVVAEVNGCASLASATFSNLGATNPPDAPVISTQNPSCSGNGTAVISNHNSSFTYQFTPSGPTVDGSGNINNLQTNVSYTVIADDGNCISTESASFNILAALSIPNTPTISSIPATCLTPQSSSIGNYNANHTYFFAPTGPTVDASGNISGMTFGTSYTVNANDGTCSSLESVVFSNEASAPPPVSPTFTIIPPTCTQNGGAVVSNYNVGYSYVFTPTGPVVGANGVITGLNPGTDYTAIADDGNCVSVASNTLNVASQFTPPTASISGTLTHCPGINTTITASGGNTYVWSNASGAVIGNAASVQVQQGVYTVTVIDANGCSGSSDASVSAHPTPTPPNITVSELICLGDPVTFSCQIPTSAQIYWEGPNNFESNQEVFTLNNTSVNELGIYSAYLVDVNGCVSQEATYPLTVSENYSFDDFILPNVITVNDDAVNETLDIDGFLKTCDDYTMTYFNRWGNLIMSHGRGQTPFSGKTADGQDLADGVYFYKLVYFSGGQQKQVEKAGFVHVLR